MSIIFRKFLNEKVNVSVRIGNPPTQFVLTNLNLNDKLSNIRKELEKNSEIKISDTLSFAKKTDVFSKIANEDEEGIILDDITEKTNDDFILYLVKNSKANWKFLSYNCYLEYGRTITCNGIKKADRKAFIMEDCKMIEIGGKGCRKGKMEFSSREDCTMKSNLFFTSDINVQNFVNLGLSLERSQNESFNVKTSSTCRYIEYGKVSLKFSEFLKPTPEFINAIDDAIKSKDLREFKQITEEFGQFIPDEVILGGRVYYEEENVSKGTSKGNDNKLDVKIGIQALKKFGIGNTTGNSSVNTNSSKCECTKLIGGEQPESFENFDEKAWVKSLNEGNWDCIEFKNPVSIFQLLPDDLREQIILSLGKRIIHSNIEDYKYSLEEFGKSKVFEFNIPLNISKIVQNKDADCNVFATVIDTEQTKNDIFNCQVLCQPNGKPRLIIHCIQKVFQKRECKLKIGWMIIGYHTNFNSILTDSNIQFDILKQSFDAEKLKSTFNKELLDFEYNLLNKKNCFGIPVLSKLDSSNDSLVIGHHFFNAQESSKIGSYTFSYCLKHNHYVNLPDFTFCTLIISNYFSPDDYGILSFSKTTIMKKMSNIIKSPKSNSLEQIMPKYISLLSTREDHCGPVFLKQKFEEVKKKHIGSIDQNSCKQATCICKNKALDEKILKYAFFNLHK